MKRRHVLLATAAAMLPVTAAAATGQRLGIVVYSYSKRWKGKYSNLRFPPFQDALDFLDHVRGLGVGSVQVGVEGWTAEFARKMRANCESYGLNLEGIIQLPRAKEDVERFERDLQRGGDAGAAVFRTALGGRRYELFTARDDYEQWLASAMRSMELAEPVARRLKARIGVENHKDFECTELVEALRKIASPHIGACLDTGNSLALLEQPLEVVAALAPFAVTVHLKDLAVHESADGFEMAEVPLGHGCLPLSEMVKAIRQANAEARFHLEMITRDPLAIPCLSEGYWKTFPKKPGIDLARTLAMVKARGAAKLNRLNGMAVEAALILEETNISQSLAYAGEKLGFDQQSLKALSPKHDP